MSIDYMTMNRKDLESHRKDLDKAMSSLDDRERKAALAAAEKAAAEHGFSLSDIVAGGGRSQTKGRAKGVPKYRNPADPSQTWTGKGRRPKWILEAEEAGRPVSDFEIE